MKIDRCKKQILCVDDKISVGDWLKSKCDDWHHVINVKGENYIQDTPLKYSIQSWNYEKAKQVIYIFDGYFLNKMDIEDVYKLYTELYSPNRTKIELELMEYKSL